MANTSSEPTGKKPIKGSRFEFVVTATGCTVCTNRKMTKRGYFHAWNPELKQSERYHRTVWKRANGDIPEGHEVHHKCRNPGCSTLEHLECLPADEHRAVPRRWKPSLRKQTARDHWLNSRCSGVALSKLFGITPSGASRWIKEWRNEAN